MANIEPIKPQETLGQTFDRINRQFNELDNDVKSHKTSKQAHKAEDIVYSGTSNVKQAIDAQGQRISDIVAQSGDDITEIVDARGGYTVIGDRLGAADERLNNKIIVTENPPAVANRLEGSFYFHVTDSVPIPTDNDNLRVSPSMGIKILE
ncbi:MAG: hypothetical protein NAG76_22515 [Candidatus Pristimantibacillus lignocellulolyticus]|uniref:Uncharacterized protein n=1 Tax=Candidatus Pristimantibacillus lignocellulolyticus TaxID=2994561 RepID=A0A9J6ZEH2_9BACL|nr:MAG: hypothetical protein NAG76_22515 [Candidatus Pristimantibacillus lignocellulolyticus]